MKMEGRPLENLIDMYKESEGRFVVLNELTQIILTYPVSSNEAERSFSALRRLYTWLQATMKTERLCSLGRAV